MNAKGALTAGIALVVLYLVFKIYEGGKTVVAAIGDATTAAGEATGGAIYTAINGDANAQVQSQVQQIEAALKAQGSPLPGSPLYNQIVAQFNPALVVQNSLSGGSSNGG